MKAKTALLTVSAVLLLASGGLFAYNYILSANAEKNIPEDVSSAAETAEVTEAVTEPYIPQVFVECSNDDIHKGNLILVNRDYEYVDESNTNITNIYSSKSESYNVNSVNMLLDREMIEAINSMLDDFAAQTGITDILANSGYRSYSEQRSMYENDLAATGLDYSELVAPPGNSEHHTGYAMDFAIDDGEYFPALKNEGEYSWIYNNAHKYGMILRYTEENKHITGYMAESWHFRYVGEPHASLIKKMGVAYEQYVSFLKDFSFEKPLEYKHSDNEFYRIYYVPADKENGKTDVPVTFEAFQEIENGYSVSGNNIDGFIVTVRESELSDDYDDSYLYMFRTEADNTEETADVSSYEDEVQSDETQEESDIDTEETAEEDSNTEESSEEEQE